MTERPNNHSALAFSPAHREGATLVHWGVWEEKSSLTGCTATRTLVFPWCGVSDRVHCSQGCAVSEAGPELWCGPGLLTQVAFFSLLRGTNNDSILEEETEGQSGYGRLTQGHTQWTHFRAVGHQHPALAAVAGSAATQLVTPSPSFHCASEEARAQEGCPLCPHTHVLPKRADGLV